VKLPFRRNQTEAENLPTEIKEYYQTERRERVGVAWLLALGTLVLTLILATGLFFGGRWAYRKLAGSDNKPETAQTDTSEEAGTDTQADPSSPQTSSEGQTGTSSASTSTPSNVSSTSPATPTTAGATTALPNTGPGEVFGLVASATLAGTVAHSTMYRRRSARK
jgi:hypothetical protein